MKQEQDTVIAGILYKVVCTDSLQSWANQSRCNLSGYCVISSPTKLALRRTVAPLLPSWERRVKDRGGGREVCKHDSPSPREMGEGTFMDYNLCQVHAFDINKDDTAWLDARAFLQCGWCLCSEEQTVAFETDEILPLSLTVSSLIRRIEIARYVVVRLCHERYFDTPPASESEFRLAIRLVVIPQTLYNSCNLWKRRLLKSSLKKLVLVAFVHIENVLSEKIKQEKGSLPTPNAHSSVSWDRILARGEENAPLRERVVRERGKKKVL